MDEATVPILLIGGPHDGEVYESRFRGELGGTIVFDDLEGDAIYVRNEEATATFTEFGR